MIILKKKLYYMINNEITVAFGSCNRQNLPQTHWNKISKHNLSYYLWLGDAIYVNSYTIISLNESLVMIHYKIY